MRIGFLQATNVIDVHWWPNLAFGSLKAYLHKHFGDSITMERAHPGNLHEYDISALSCITQDYNIAKQIAYAVKQRNPKAKRIFLRCRYTASSKSDESEKIRKRSAGTAKRG